MKRHDVRAYEGFYVERQGFVAECHTCPWWAWFVEYEDARRHAERHVALTAEADE